MPRSKPFADTFTYFRKAWSPRASWHLARMRYDSDWQNRLASFFWLLGNRVPPTGAAPSLNFRGLPLAH